MFGIPYTFFFICFSFCPVSITAFFFCLSFRLLPITFADLAMVTFSLPFFIVSIYVLPLFFKKIIMIIMMCALHPLFVYYTFLFHNGTEFVVLLEMKKKGGEKPFVRDVSHFTWLYVLVSTIFKKKIPYRVLFVNAVEKEMEEGGKGRKQMSQMIYVFVWLYIFAFAINFSLVAVLFSIFPLNDTPSFFDVLILMKQYLLFSCRLTWCHYNTRREVEGIFFSRLITPSNIEQNNEYIYIYIYVIHRWEGSDAKSKVMKQKRQQQQQGKGRIRRTTMHGGAACFFFYPFDNSVNSMRESY
ncbi:hypothetical protein Tb09.211.0250 [Trypanosoma brucei brucei TREU927]|uniref:Uncharacterized protein n=1 Tax=Trypanosoma brucei brucei (strain 927/4 GUTat10.1) TaxID=185431 RepID=Q38ED5_TRYB2|nr:hypothetical protein Tb09.211.0250 [Trypanosoma brucei brucei TREU927]EAN76835.1 hypothetical protein Tb09.211.0250 [Trypanosoma brucei brucei TREU927]